MALLPAGTAADDIDIFVGSSAGSAANPNVLIVLDNTSNWARQSQQWPGGLQQGQSEARAIKKAIAQCAASGKVNVGLMEFATNGTANDNGGFIRYSIQPMTDANKAAFGNKLDTIYNNITSPDEKRSSNTPYGNLMYDVYNYYAGANVSKDNSNKTRDLNPPNPDTDPNGYEYSYTQFNSPLSKDKACARNFMIFIGNPNANGPNNDSSYNTSALSGLGGDTSELLLPYFTQTAVSNSTTLGNTSACYSSPAAAQTDYGWGWNSVDNLCQLYAATTTKTGTLSSPGDLVGALCDTYDATKPKTTTPTDWQTTCASYTQGCTIGGPLNLTKTVSTSGWTSYVATTPSNNAAAGALVVTDSNGNATQPLTCPNNAISCSFTVTTSDPTGTHAPKKTTNYGAETAETSTCWVSSSTNIPLGATPLPSPSSLTYTSGLSSTAVTGVGLDATMAHSLNPPGACILKGSDGTCNLTCPANTLCTYSWALNTSKTIAGTVSCKKSTGQGGQQSYPADVTMTPTALASYYVTMTYTIPDPNNTCPNPSTQNHYEVKASNIFLTNVPTGQTFSESDKLPSLHPPLNADEWSRLLYEKGVPVEGGDNQSVTTYTIDVYNRQPNNIQTSLLLSMANVGRGKYFSANNEDQISKDLCDILAEIQAVNSTFASASLPVSTTNRAQNENQVYIGMFRPNQDDYPRWMGNMKRYQLVMQSDGSIDLGDANGDPALNLNTGFLTDCATSWWTADSSDYWKNVIEPGSPSLASKCLTTTHSPYSDLPDGPMVEKGAVAEVIRKGNDPAAATPTWQVNRNLYTLNASGGLVNFDATSASSLSSDALSFTQGHDAQNEENLPSQDAGYKTITRPSVHGDVIHSRPLPINYATASNSNAGVTVYYGANDGTLRAVDAATGKEQWAFIAPEAFNAAAGRNYPSSSTDPLTRLMTDSPKIYYPGIPISGTLPKDYFFDGSVGLFQNLDNTRVWIYPSMRRGGRMLYAFDVSLPSASASAPSVTFKWRAGCPNLTTDTADCKDGTKTHDLSGIGQTWSTPNVAFLKGYSKGPVVVVGGGYDSCEDADTTSPSCSSPKGAAVYVFDAGTGELLKSLPTTRSVAADVAYVDIDGDSYPDYAYAADTGGNLYRINFIDTANGGTPLSPDNSTIQRVAYTNGSYRKFLFSPTPLPYQGKVYLAIGSGDREHPLGDGINGSPANQYPYRTPVINRFYVYLDDPASSTVTDLDGSTMDDFTNTNDRGCDNPTFTSDSGKKGWFMELPGRGEQTVTSALMFGGMVAFSTNRPIPPAEGSCPMALGEARGYLVDLLNASGSVGVTGTCGGTRSGTFAGGGLPPSPVMATVPVENVTGSTGSSASIETVAIGVVKKSGGGGGDSSIGAQKVTPPINPIRRPIYWKSSGDND